MNENAPTARELARRGIIRLRGQLGLSQVQMGKRIGAVRSLVCMLETGRRSALGYLDRYARAGGVTVESIMAGHCHE